MTKAYTLFYHILCKKACDIKMFGDIGAVRFWRVALAWSHTFFYFTAKGRRHMKGFGIAFILHGFCFFIWTLLQHNSFFGHPKAPDSVLYYEELYQTGSRILEESMHRSYWLVGIGVAFIVVGLLYEAYFARKKCHNCHTPHRKDGVYCSPVAYGWAE